MAFEAIVKPRNCSCTRNVHECQQEPVCSGAWCVKYYKLDLPGRTIEAEFCADDIKFHCGDMNDMTRTSDHVYQLCCNDRDMCNRDLHLPRHITVLYEEKPEPGPTFKDFVTNPHFMYFVALPIVVTVLAIISCIVLSQQKRKLKRRLQERLVLETDVPTQNQSELTSTRYGRGPLANATILAHHGAINLAIDSQGSSCEPLMTSSRLPDTSNSKALGAYLSMRTISSDVQLDRPIGMGRYGQVFLGRYATSYVAVKKLPCREESSWQNERRVYSYLRHHSVLQFIASDRVATGIATELWLVVDYHKNGSLFDVLVNNAIILNTEDIALRMMTSIAAGLVYLHQNIIGTPPDVKPAVAHCDLKSRNILVKDDLSCCIADFGLAVTPQDFSPNAHGIESRRRRYIIGTRRYSPPDLLNLAMTFGNDESITKTSRLNSDTKEHLGESDTSSETNCEELKVQYLTFEHCRQADIYSAGLIFWEISRRVKPWGLLPGKLPYFEYFAVNEPTIAEAYDVVYKQKIRPCFPPSAPPVDAPPITTNSYMQDDVARQKPTTFCKVQRLIEECWSHNASARIPALLVKKKLDKLGDAVAAAKKDVRTLSLFHHSQCCSVTMTDPTGALMSLHCNHDDQQEICIAADSAQDCKCCNGNSNCITGDRDKQHQQQQRCFYQKVFDETLA